MQISVRSYLTAGMTAVVGASAIALTPALPSPALQSVQLPAPAIAEIALTGTSIPWEQIWTLLQTVGTGGSLSNIVNIVFGAVGTEFATQALPLVTATLTDVTTYLGAALNDVLHGSGALQIDLPGIFAGVGTALSHGDLPGALQTLTGGLSAPITHVVQTVFGPDFQAFLVNKAGTVLGALPELLRSAVQKVLGLDIKPVTDAIAKILSGLVPSVPSAASVPVALAAAAVPTIVPTLPAIRAAEPATQVTAVVAEAPAAPRSAAAVSADAPAKSDPVAAPAGDAPAVTVDIPESVAQAEPETAAAPSRATRRGSAEAGGTAASAPRAAAGHRGAGDAGAAAAKHAGR